MAGRKRIAFLIVNIFEIYHSNTWPGAVRAAEELGYDLFILPGFEPNTPDVNDRQHNCIYQFLNTFPFDGFIIVSNTFGTYNTEKKLGEFISPFHTIPHVCVGAPIGDAPTIKVDQKAGLIEALEHLIIVHNLKRFAYIRGPVGHPEAEIRYQTFLQVLNKYELSVEEQLLYTGNFLPESGIKAVEEWIKRKQMDVDAVIAANDLMAIAALNTLEEHGFSVPKDIAILGFDDMKECRFTKAPLTTVSQPLSTITYEAVRVLDQMLNGRPITRSLLLPTKAVIRRSCGCFSSMIQNISTPRVAVSERDFKDPSHFAHSIADKYSNEFPDLKNNVNEIINIILTSSQKEDYYEEFINTLDSILVKELKDLKDISIWNDIFNEIFTLFSGYFKDTKNLSGPVFMQRVRIYIGEMIERRQLIINSRSINEFRKLHDILRLLSNALEKEKIAGIIHRHLWANGIPVFFLFLYDKPVIWQDGKDWEFPGQSRLFAGYTDYGKTILTDTSPFPTIDLLKSAWLKTDRPEIYVIHPLFFEKTHLGYMVAAMGPKNGLIYESLRAQLASSLLSSFLFEENKAKEQMANEKSEHIQSVILPMLDSINHVNSIAMANIEAIARLVDQTEQSSNKLHTANESVGLIVENVKEIRGLINIIDDISMNINLLSINASIQSARAGEHGKGFAIIAQEIRKLADSTASNAKRTAESLNTVVKSVHQSQNTSEESVQSFTNLKKKISAVYNSFTEISKKMESLAKSSQEIFEMMK